MECRRFIAVDQGNSFFKLTLMLDGEVMEVCRIPSGSAEDIFLVMDRFRPDCGAFCSVGRMDSRLIESLRIALDGRLLILSRSTPLPIAIKYATPATLGLDRVALAAGVAAIYPGECLMVVDAGTAVTLDVVGSDGAFLGGRITAGVRLRLESLHAFTSALPLVEADGPLPLIGDSTETSIRAGVVGGLADEITGTFRKYKETYGCTRLVLTGGDAGLLFGGIPSHIPADLVPDLMAGGLLYIYNYNENYN